MIISKNLLNLRLLQAIRVNMEEVRKDSTTKNIKTLGKETDKPGVDYDKLVEERAQHVFDVMATRTSTEDMRRLKDAFEFAREAHKPQKRRSGEPYILHPIAVANIAASEINLDVNSVIAAFLHDVVEDTPHTIEEIQERFGEDVAFLVRVVTKQKKFLSSTPLL